MSALAKEKYEEILEVIARESEIKSMARAHARKAKNAEKCRHKELSTKFNCSMRKVHEKSLSERKPKIKDPSLREILNTYYAEF